MKAVLTTTVAIATARVKMNPSWSRNYCFCILFNIFLWMLQAQEIFETTMTTVVANETLRKITHHDQDNTTAEVFGNKSRLSNIDDSLKQGQINSELMLRMVYNCETPNNDTGYCMPLTNCTKLMNQLENHDARDFLKKSHCGPKNENPSNPYVCCGKYDNYKYLVKEDPMPKSCGYQRVAIRGRILGGKKAALGEFPWMARLIHKHPDSERKTFGCAGFLIAAKYVLTAAHCLESENVPILGPIYEVQFGEHNTETKIDCNSKNTVCADKPQVIRIKKNIVHPHYSVTSTNHHNDIGLIHLKKSAKFTNYVSPICLLDKVDFEPFEYWISGWGKTKTQSFSSIKMKVSLPPYPHSNCTEKYSHINIQINNKQLCAGGIKNKDSCTGDSGGPLMLVKDGNHWFAAGVVSYGLGCGKEGWPGVYSNITSYFDWIQSTILKRASSKSKVASSN